VFVPRADRPLGDDEWRAFVVGQKFGHMIAPGAGRPWPAVAPTQFVLDGDTVLAHFAAPNPVLDALAENDRAVLSVAGDWAFIPSDWKTIGAEDPRTGIPTTYYAAVQLRGRAEVVAEPERIARVLRRQLAELQPETDVADPEEAHPTKLRAIRAVVVAIEEVVAKFKYGGNVDAEHRLAVADRLAGRNGPGDAAAISHLRRRLDAGR
jgi:transcriptional regulator